MSPLYGESVTADNFAARVAKARDEGKVCAMLAI